MRSFARYRDIAANDPVYITSYGRPTHVLLSASAYEGLEDRARQGGGNPGVEAMRHFYFSMMDWIDYPAFAADENFVIQHANKEGIAATRSTLSELAGKNLADVFENFSGSLIETQLRRTIVSNEATSADLPSPWKEGQWLYVRTFPVLDTNILLVRDMSEHVGYNRLADVKSAILKAMDQHGGIAYARLSVRGTIDSCDQVLADMVGLPRERLIGVRFRDLLALKDRTHFRESLEHMYRTGEGERFTISLIGNDGNDVPVTLALSNLHGAYGLEGAVVIVTPD